MPLILPSAALVVVLSRPTTSEMSRRDAQQAAPPDTQPKKKPKKPPQTYPSFRFDDHPSIHFGKGTHLDLRARFAGDVIASDAATDDEGGASTLDLGKKRLGVSGEIRNAVEFEIEAGLTGSEPWRDVYADVKRYDKIRLRGGQFKIPFSLDENTSAAKLDFMFRSLAATHLAPGRDPGLMVHGKLLDKVLAYEAGVFSHDGRNARTGNAEKVSGGTTIAGRITVAPFANVKHAAADLSLGGAFTVSDVPEGIAGLRGQTVFDQNFFSSSNYLVSGQRRRLGLEMALAPGPASIKAEWMRVTTERRGQSVEDTDLSPLIGQGWYVSGTYALTGEKKSAVHIPDRPLLPGRGYGAIELAARVEKLTFRSGASGEPGSASPRADVILGNGDKATTVGVNWYVNRWLKIQANIIRETLDDPSQGPLPSKPTFTSKAVRFQFSL